MYYQRSAYIYWHRQHEIRVSVLYNSEISDTLYNQTPKEITWNNLPKEKEAVLVTTAKISERKRALSLERPSMWIVSLAMHVHFPKEGKGSGDLAYMRYVLLHCELLHVLALSFITRHTLYHTYLLTRSRRTSNVYQAAHSFLLNICTRKRTVKNYIQVLNLVNNFTYIS